jgi:large subunit ribosomal protein L13
MRTYSPKASEITRDWHVIDAEGMVLGRVCTEAARLLRGKHKPVFAPHLDTGDHVVIVNADKVVLTSGKAERHMVHRYSGYPGGLKSESYADLLARKPADAVRRSIRGMLPKGPLGRQMLRKLKVYAGPTHPHAAQRPQPLELAHARPADAGRRRIEGRGSQ